MTTRMNSWFNPAYGCQSLFRCLPSSVKSRMKEWRGNRSIQLRHDAAFEQLRKLASEISEHCLSGVNALTTWQKSREEFRQSLRYMLGLDQIKCETITSAKITGTVTRPAYRIEKLVFESLPGLYVTANLYLPNKCSSPLPCVVYLNGHWPSLDGAKVGFQDRYLWYPANGLALLVIDPMGFGEVPGVHPGTNRLGMWHWISLGYTPAGVEVWNAMRAIDWLATRPEIDSSRIGVTGISGGGVMTQYLAALDDRVAVIAVSCSTYTIGNQVAQGLIPQQCDCTFYPNVYRTDFSEVLALIAPRPLLILGGCKDPIFPPAGFREAFRQTKRVYDLYDENLGVESRIKLVESNQGHTDPPHFLKETRKWMCRWLGVDVKSVEMDIQPEPELPETLRCINKIPSSALNYHIHDYWFTRPNFEVPRDLATWSRRKEYILGVLQKRVFGWFPQHDIPFKTRRVVSSGGYAGNFTDYQEYEFDSESGVPVSACLFKPKDRKGPVPLILWSKEFSDHVAFPDLDEFFPLLRTHALVILSPRFTEKSTPAHEHAAIERSAVLVGRSITAMQVWDVLRTVVWVTSDCKIKTSGITVFGSGDAGIAGLYAAIMKPTIERVILRNPPATHLDGPALPTILRDTDIEEVAGMFAPRRLTLLGHRHGMMPLTNEIYALVGASAAFGHAGSITEAILGKGEASKC